MPVCRICQKRPGKRTCPAVSAKICAICCARDRMIELACPESCSYLVSARSNALENQIGLRLAAMNEVLKTSEAVTPTVLFAVSIIDDGIVRTERGAFPDMADVDINDALSHMLETDKMMASGLIYAPEANSLRASQITDQITGFLKQALEAEGAKAESHRHPLPSHQDIIAAIRVIKRNVELHLSRQDDPRAYLRFVSLFVKWPEEETGPRIIL